MKKSEYRAQMESPDLQTIASVMARGVGTQWGQVSENDVHDILMKHPDILEELSKLI